MPQMVIANMLNNDYYSYNSKETVLCTLLKSHFLSIGSILRT